MVTAHKHIPAMHQRNRLDDRQPQPMVIAAVAARSIDPVEALEQTRQVLAGNRRAGVGDANADLMLFGLDPYLNDLPGLGVLHRVAQQIDQRPAQMRDLDPHLRIAADLHLNLGVFKNEIQVFQGRRHFIRQRGGGQFGRLAALVGAGEEQHVVDDRTQSLKLFEVRLQHFEIMLGRTSAGQRDLGLADQVGQWRAQFVGDVGVERFKARVGLLDPLQRGVERVDELIQFRRQ